MVPRPRHPLAEDPLNQGLAPAQEPIQPADERDALQVLRLHAHSEDHASKECMRQGPSNPSQADLPDFAEPQEVQTHAPKRKATA
eukprot:CAMPEP_0175583420 /NCGR_PEP_ID=MMETSP0096-20121207/48648_1 /TAXON_ID=311494 /ORGANISM="Alexandrium monilatum, Strain CCMP3105" /LENGTH=84 /DNA_ID=CAMNT_0016887133 /DNA_START=159 /DNA_END=410 /DNA_ORIENTATION=-